MDGSGTGYLRTAAEYVHLNPVRAKLLKDEEPLRNQPMARSQPLWPGAAGNRRGPCAPNHRRDLAPGAVAPEKFQLFSANHRIKVALARQLRQETTMELKWIADELGIGSWKYLSNLLKAEECTSKQCELGL